MLHEDRAVLGHAMVVWRRHVENISDLDDDEARHFINVHAQVERAVLALTGRERAVILKLGIQVPHLHVHIYPVAATASRTDVMAAIDGKVNEDANEDFETRLRERLRERLERGAKLKIEN